MALYISRRKLLSALKLPALSNPTISLHFRTHNSSSYYYYSTNSTTTSKPHQTQSITDYLVNSHQLSPETASKASSTLTHVKTFHNVDAIIKYLKDSGFTTAHLDTLLKRKPNILFSNLELTIKPKMELLQSLGISPPDMAELLSIDPNIFSRDVHKQLGSSILALRNFLGSDEGVIRALKVSTIFLKYNLEKTFVPNIELFKSYGICEEQIQQFVYNFPKFLLYKPETMMGFVRRVDELGLSRNSRVFLHAVRVLSSMSEEKWKSKLDLFRRLGFTEEDIVASFRKSPQVFAASERKIMEVSKALLSAAEPDSKFVVKHPDLLLCSLKQRIIPRLKVVDALEERNLLKRRPTLLALLKISSEMFCARYVLPHSDVVGKLYTAQ